MESAARNPYSLTRPVFELIPGGRVDTDNESDLLKSLRVIENRTAEIQRMLGTSTQGASEVASSSIKSLWRLFWACQVIGFASLIVAELGRLGSFSTKNLKFLGLGLIFVALECVFVAKFVEHQGVSHGREETRDTDA